MPDYIIPNWPAPKNIHAYTTTKNNRYSKTRYENSAEAHRVTPEENAVLINELKLPATPIWLKQVHGKHVVVADTINDFVEADASFTKKQNTVCVVNTADCLPLLLCNREGTIVAAIHAGWKGLAAGIIQETIKAMNIPGEELLAWMGPAIGPQMFEVGYEVREKFINQNKKIDAAFTPHQPPGKWLANIYIIARVQLNQLNVTQIYGGDFCTFTDKERFYSYRRDKGVTGRMATLIWMS